MTRVVVIGAGVSGLVAAIRLARAGARVTLLAKGTGGLQLSQGTVDILGYGPQRVERPLEALAGFADANPGHPYAFLDAELVGASASYLAELVGPALLVGDPAVKPATADRGRRRPADRAGLAQHDGRGLRG